MELKVCTECGAKNRIERFRVRAQARCGRCGIALAEPTWIHILRMAQKYSIPIVVLCSMVFYYGYEQVRTPNHVRSNYVSTVADNSVPLQVLSPNVRTKQTPAEKPHEQCTAVPIAQGLHSRYTKARALAPFRVETKPGGSYFVVLIDDATDATVLTAYTSGGQALEMKVPFGLYRVNYAYGASSWCGETELFGDGTEVVALDSKLDFGATNTEYKGHVISLIRQIDGNLTTTPISPKQLFGKGSPLRIAK